MLRMYRLAIRLHRGLHSKEAKFTKILSWKVNYGFTQIHNTRNRSLTNRRNTWFSFKTVFEIFRCARSPILTGSRFCDGRTWFKCYSLRIQMLIYKFILKFPFRTKLILSEQVKDGRNLKYVFLFGFFELFCTPDVLAIHSPLIRGKKLILIFLPLLLCPWMCVFLSQYYFMHVYLSLLDFISRLVSFYFSFFLFLLPVSCVFYFSIGKLHFLFSFISISTRSQTFSSRFCISFYFMLHGKIFKWNLRKSSIVEFISSCIAK